MSYFKPNPRIINFIYETATRNLYLNCKVDIPLPANKNLLKYNPNYDPAQLMAGKVYDHDPNAPSSLARTLVDEFKVAIMINIDIPYDPNDPGTFLAALRSRMAPIYTLKATVKIVNNDPNTGGINTNTIDRSEEIQID